MTNVGKGKAIFFSSSVHDRGLYLECVILIAPGRGGRRKKYFFRFSP